MNIAFTRKPGQPLRCTVCRADVADTWWAKTAHWQAHQIRPDDNPTTAEEPTT